ncbi:glycosyltransferase family 4 protein [Ancylomarina sp. YFZ004]
MKKKLIRITTVPISLHKLLHGQLNYMQVHFNVLAISSGGDTLKRVKNEQSVAVFPLEMSRTISPLKDCFSLWRMYLLLKKQKPEIVHTHTPKAGIVGMLAAKLAGIPIRMHTVAGLPLMEASGPKRVLLNWVEKLTYSCATKVYPNSYGLQDFILKEEFCKQDKLKVIGQGSSNGIDTSKFFREQIKSETQAALREEYDLDEKHTVFCFVGRLVGDKGINELVTAFGKLYTKDSSVRFLLVGDLEKDLDPLLPDVEKLIENHPGIIAAGWQEDVRPFLSISDVFVFPSYREGFPNVVMQAGAMELPCIVSDINGCNEIIKEGINGMIIPPKKENELYNAMLELLENREKRELLTSFSRQMIVDRYEQKYVWQELLKEYSSLVDSQ